MNTVVETGHARNIAVRAIRFGWHLGWHYPGLLWREIVSAVTSLMYWPEFKMCADSTQQHVEVITEYPVATDSPDHLHPHGTLANHMTHFGFVAWCNNRFGPRRAMLDLGCSSGRLVRDFRKIGWKAVGLEGSDWSLKSGRPCWDLEAGHSLFTCDIGKPWTITNNGQRMIFDLITCIQTLEHLDRPRLAILATEIMAHSQPGTHFVISTANNSEVQDGAELHVTQWDRQQWLQFFAQHLPEFIQMRPVPDCFRMRRSHQDLDFLLKRQ